MKTPEELKVIHEHRQAGYSLDEICIRENIVLRPHADSFFPFEFFCYRSPEMQLEMDTFIEYAKGKKCFLDIGALHGIFALVFAEMNKEGKSYAFEPSPKAFEKLKSNTETYNNIKIFRKAISDGYGVLNMSEEWDHYVASDSKDGHEVKCFSGDTFCEDIEPVDACKIDVEGMELEVLKGLSKTITKNHPVIFLELHMERLEKRGDAVFEILNMIKEWNYQIIDSRTNQEISPDAIIQEKTGELRLILL